MGSIKKMIINLYESIYSSDLVMSYFYKKKYKGERFNIMPSDKTVDYVIEHKCSVSRFGEGEIWGIIDNRNLIGFQKYDEKLAKALKRVLCNKNKRLLLCLPYALNDISGRTKHSRSFWFNWSEENEQRKKTFDLISETSGIDYQFGDTQISRPYMAYLNKNKAAKQFEKLKQLWNQRDVLIVEGRYTRLGVGNDILDNVRSVQRILCPAENAFDKYDIILAEIKKYYTSQLILIALGPTATVLASDLADYGAQAIDLGHIDIEYEWYLSGATDHNIVKGKYVNEAENGSISSYDISDPLYESQIIHIID